MTQEEKIYVRSGGLVFITFSIGVGIVFIMMLLNLAGVPLREEVNGTDYLYVIGAILIILFSMVFRWEFTIHGHRWFFILPFMKKPLIASKRTKWKDCFITLDFGWPIYPINITPAQFPMMKYFVHDYYNVCKFIYKHGVDKAETGPKAREYLKRVSKKH